MFVDKKWLRKLRAKLKQLLLCSSYLEQGKGKKMKPTISNIYLIKIIALYGWSSDESNRCSYWFIYGHMVMSQPKCCQEGQQLG